MDKNEIIERLERLARCAVHTVGELPFVMSLDDGIAIHEAIDMLRSQPEPHWIPCSERLPEKNCRCLTTNTAWGAFEVDFNVWINGEWLCPNEKPIAWMPLPKPYREDDHVD